MAPKASSNLKSMNEDDFVKAVNHALDHGYNPHPQSKLFGGDIFSWIKGDYGVSSAKESFEVPPNVVKLGSDRMAIPLSLMHANSYASKRIVSKRHSVDFGPLNVLGATAFHGAQYIAPLKRNIISYALGEQRIPLLS
ncbi:hypothetical protein LguiB_013706 [Lonicera macranthoides]